MTTARPTSSLIQVYGIGNCKQTESVRRKLNSENIPFEYVDVELDLDAAQWIESLTEGVLVTPVLDLFGKILIQPSKSKLDLAQSASDLRLAV